VEGAERGRGDRGLLTTPEVLYEGLDFGEGPRWHDGRLWLSDFWPHHVISIGPGGDARIELELDDQPSGLGWLPSGELLVVAMTSRQVRRVDADGNVHLHGDLSSIATGQANDMVVDAHGNAYVGNFGFDMEGGERPAAAALALVRPDGTVEVAATELRFPNGSVITPDGATLVVGESMGGRYTAFTIQEDGTLTDRRTWAEVPGHGPDGCCLDADGHIWMADAFGAGCFLVAEGGEILDQVEASQPDFACALGGEDGRTLFLLSAPTFGEEACAGKGLAKVETVEVSTPGAAGP
jgi:sugar lactone lactonase YvrE